MERKDFSSHDPVAHWRRRAIEKTAEEQRELILQYRAGSSEALDLVIRATIRFVIREASRYVRINNAGRWFPDLVQEGALGVMEAAERYDPRHESGASFLTYAEWWIRTYMSRFLIRQLEDVRLPEDKVVRLSGFKGSAVFSFSDSLHDSDDERTQGDVIADERQEDLVSRLSFERNAKEVIAFIRRKFGEHQADFVAAFFGLDGHRESSFVEIALEHHVKPRLVQQTIARVLRHSHTRRFALGLLRRSEKLTSRLSHRS